MIIRRKPHSSFLLPDKTRQLNINGNNLLMAASECFGQAAVVPNLRKIDKDLVILPIFGNFEKN